MQAPHLSFRPTRRGFLLGLGATMALGGTRAAFADAPGDRRLVVVLLRGALDGLFAVQPYGDPDFAALRGPLALPEPPGRRAAPSTSAAPSACIPASPPCTPSTARGAALILHAAPGPYRSRSHFEARDLLESGASSRLTSGWLNRAVEAMPNPAEARAGLAIGTGVPLLLHGPVPVGSYAPRAPTVPPPT